MKAINVDDLVRDYLAGKSVKELSNQLGVWTGTVKSMLLANNVKLRTRSETAKLFNRGSKEPKVVVPKAVSAVMVRDYLAGDSPDRIAKTTGFGRAVVYRELKAAGVLRDCSDAQKVKWSLMTPKQREAVVGPAHRANTGRKQDPVNLIKSAATRQRRLTFLFPSETSLLESLRGVGYTVIPQRAVGPYNLDSSLEEPRVAVEVQSGSPGGFLKSTRSRERLEYILNRSWSVLFVAIRRCGFIFPDVTQKVLTFAETAGRGKPCFGQYGVIGSDGKSLPGCGPDLDGLTRVIGF